jgi:hypothetical protein
MRVHASITHTPPPQSSVQSHEPVSASHSHREGMHSPSPGRTQLRPSSHPAVKQLSGDGGAPHSPGAGFVSGSVGSIPSGAGPASVGGGGDPSGAEPPSIGGGGPPSLVGPVSRSGAGPASVAPPPPASGSNGSTEPPPVSAPSAHTPSSHGAPASASPSSLQPAATTHHASSEAAANPSSERGGRRSFMASSSSLFGLTRGPPSAWRGRRCEGTVDTLIQAAACDQGKTTSRRRANLRRQAPEAAPRPRRGLALPRATHPPSA